MDNLNWGTWLRGLISSVSNGAITVLAAIAVLQEWPATWKLFVIGGVPLLFNFFSYIKQSPPPFGYKVVKEEIVSQVTKTVDIPPK
jgi:hypothetical protein